MNNEFIASILIVEDIQKNVEILLSVLSKNNYILDFANNGSDALQKIETKNYDLILLDIMMPVMDGFEFLRIIKEQDEKKEIPVIILTGNTSEDDVVKGLELGAIDYITKPFRKMELLARVKNHLDLSHSRKELKESSYTKDKLFNIIAHDLKNLFTILLGISNLVTEDIDSHSKESLKEYFELIQNATNQNLNQINNLLIWSRTQLKKLNIKIISFNIVDIVMDSIKSFNEVTQSKKIEIKVNLSEKVPVMGDPNLIKVIIDNLLYNAIKYTNISGKIEISNEYFDNNIILKIGDDGVGIPLNNKDSLFKIDSTVKTYGTNKEKGSGIGLALSKILIELNNGKIWFTSEVNKGSIFYLSLPKE